MSYLGRKPIKIPNQVKLKLENNALLIEGPLGSIERKLHKKIKISIDNNTLIVNKPTEKQYVPLWGLYRKLITNMIIGVSIGFSTQLEMVGVGYKAEVQTQGNINSLLLKLGFSHPIQLIIPNEITISIIKTNKSDLIVVSGINNELVNSFASKIRDFRRPEPYKGKGLVYLGEQIRKKEGKKK